MSEHFKSRLQRYKRERDEYKQAARRLFDSLKECAHLTTAQHNAVLHADRVLSRKKAGRI